MKHLKKLMQKVYWESDVKNDILIGVSDVIIDQDSAWIISDAVNGLLRYDFLREELELVFMYPDTIGTNFSAFLKIMKIEDDIYFIPLTAKDIFYYELDKGQFHKLTLPQHLFCNVKHMHPIKYGKNIYCINRFPDLVIKINCETKKMDIFVSNVSVHRDDEIEREIYRIYWEPSLYDNKIIWPNYNDTLTVFDLQREIFSSIPLTGFLHKGTRLEQTGLLKGKLRDWVIGVRAYKGILWLLTFEGEVYQYNQGSLDKVVNQIFQEYGRYSDFNNNEKIILPLFYDAIIVSDELWFIPQYKYQCIKYDGYNNKFELAINVIEDECIGIEREYNLSKAFQKSILLFSYYENCFYVLDIDKNCVYRKTLEIPVLKFVNTNAEFRKSIMPNDFCGFDDLSFLMGLVIHKQDKIVSKENTIGEKIYGLLERA